MARPLKPYKVDKVWNHQTGVSVDIMLDRDSCEFFGVVGGKRFTFKTASDCKREIRKLLHGYDGLKWRKFIEIEMSSVEDSYENYAEFGLETPSFNADFQIRRFEGAKSADKTWVQQPFKEDLEHQESAIKQWPRRKCSGRAVLPYSEKAWATLNEIIVRLRELIARLEEFTNQKDFKKKLETGFVKLIMAAKGEEVRDEPVPD